MSILAKKQTINNTYTHAFHPYPAKFTPALVRKYIDRYTSPDNIIIDPFCGSGTALVEANLKGLEAVGIDLNPIATLISKAKTNKYSANDIAIADSFLQEISNDLYNCKFNNLDFYNNPDLKIPDFYNRDHWFQDNIIFELAYLRMRMDQVEEGNAKDLLLCAFSNIIVKASNQDSEVRYTAKPKNHPNGYALEVFTRILNKYISVLKSYTINNLGISRIYNSDAYNILKKFNDNKFDYCITSPPYINTFDYYLYHKLRMFWLGYDHKLVRANEIGNHHRIDSQSLSKATLEYVSTMKSVFIELSRVLKQNSYLTIIIGDGIVDGILIDMSTVIKDLCKDLHLEIVKTSSESLYNITRSFNRKFSRAAKREHYITLRNYK